MIRIGVLMVVFIVSSLMVRAQQVPQFSQNMYNHMTVNPAFAGEQNKGMVSGIYRNQWQSMPDAPVTYALNIDGVLRIKEMNGGWGINIMNDKLGLQTMLHLMLNYSYKYKLGFGVLSAGVKIGIVNTKIEAAYSIPNSDGHTQPGDDPAINQEDLSKIKFDMGLGMFLTGNKYYAGMAVTHLTKSKFTIGQKGEFFLAPHMHFSGGYTLNLTSAIDIQPSAYIITDFISSQYTVNTNVVLNGMYWGGVSYRYEEAVVFMGGMELKNGMMMGYSYDWNVGGIGQYIGGSHEVTLSYSFGLDFKKREKKYKSVRFL